LKTTSRLALLAAAGLFVGGVAMPSAKAADLGGDCCADLEERVAELEATTARKGNRKMSLTITGQVNRMIMAWDDGRDRGVFYGIDNINSSSRFSFLGEAAATPWLKFGFEIMLEGEGTSASTRVSQINEDGTFSNTTYMAPNSVNQGTNNSGNSDSFFGDARRVAAWVEHKEIGRLTVGRYETAGAIGTIDLGGVGVVTGFGSTALLNGNFALRTKSLNNPGVVAPGYVSSVWSQYLDPAAYQSRQETLRYDSPAIHGFIFSASLSESSTSLPGGTNWGMMLRYAGEHHGFRVAAGAGFEHYGDTYTNPTQSGTGVNLICLDANQANCVAPGNATFSTASPDINAWGAALSLMHVSSGLFLQGSVQGVEFNNDNSHTTGNWGETCSASTSAGNVIGQAVGGSPITGISTVCNPKKDAWWWQLQGGIAKNWTGWGNTVLYGEYSVMHDFGAEKNTAAHNGRNFISGTSPPQQGFVGLLDVESTTATVWGVGLVQNFNNAATEWYLGYRNYSLDLNSSATCVSVNPTAGAVPNPAPAASQTVVGCKIQDMNLIVTGLRVKF
jgi:hypothetical protein